MMSAPPLTHAIPVLAGVRPFPGESATKGILSTTASWKEGKIRMGSETSSASL